MSFSIDCLTLHPPSPSKCLIHSGRFALSERDSRLPHAPTPRGRRQPHVDMPARRLHQHHERSYPQVVSTGLCMAVGVCGMSPFHLCTTPPQYHRPRASAPCSSAPHRPHLDMTSLDTEFWLKIRDNHPISRARPLGHPEAEPPTAATAHSSSPCNLSAVTTRSAERGAARFSPQFCTGSKRICG